MLFHLFFLTGLTLNISDPLFNLITNTPSISTNPVGSVSRDALVSKLKGATPGRHSEAFYMPSGKLFKTIFFPNHSPASYEGDVVGVTSLDDNWWSNFSIAVLCQSMYYQTSDLRPQLLIDNIKTAVDTFNGALRDKAVQWYTHVLRKDYVKYTGDFQEAKNIYISQICTSSWVTYKMKQYNDGTWLNPSWEEFHHWVKLSALGASDAEINKVINDLKALGLRIFSDVDIGTWCTYLVWYNPSALDHGDVDSDARQGELEEVYMPSMQGMGSYMKEENSFEFTANSQPGSQYRSVPSSSCFIAGTKVLMADGVLTEIQHIMMGDMVASPRGPRKVMFTSSPMRNGRTLFSINNHHDFWFTATHPFINAHCSSSKQPYYLAKSPLQLAHAVPTLSGKGIGHLGVGSHLNYSKGEVEVYSIQKQHSDVEEPLYDLILEPDCTGQFEYFVGDGDVQFCVASELPSFSMATTTEKLACVTIFDAIQASLKPLQSMHISMSSQLFRQKLDFIANQLSASLFCDCINNSTLKASAAQKFKTANVDFAEYLKEAAAMFISADGKYSYVAGEAFAHLSSSKLFCQLSSMLDLGFRNSSVGAKKGWMAVSLLSIHTHSTNITDEYLQPEITIFLNEFPPTKQAAKGMVAPYTWNVNNIFYVCYGNEDGVKEFVLNISIGTAAQQSKSLHACTYVVLPLNHGYRHYCIPVFCDKEEIGFLVMDVRTLSDTEVEEEKMAVSRWEDSSILPLAQRLLECTSNKLSILCTNN